MNKRLSCISILSENLTRKTDFLDCGAGRTSRSNFFIFFAYLIWVHCTDLRENGFFGILAILKKVIQKYIYPV
jgi:hypothetical protein